ncbi:TauD/TfdA family dioxygenase [Photorhabdus tasmaniensis]|uniref:TauD/TfdA family dioxygenase n=1 Tax=Photorhabdus tasmaniensis TaxID=1004159 RepID=UPI004040F993
MSVKPTGWKVDDSIHARCVIQLDPVHTEKLLAELSGVPVRPFNGLTTQENVGDEVDALMASVYECVKSGDGIVILKGISVAGLDEIELGERFLRLCSRMGKPVSQSVMGDIIGRVEDMTHMDPDARGYRNREELIMHTDQPDMVCMLCVRKAKYGGHSKFASALALHEAIEKLTSQSSLRHKGGKDSVFVHFTGSYLELIEIVDSHEFEACCTEAEQRASRFGYPYALVAATAEVLSCAEILKDLLQDVSDVRYIVPQLTGWVEPAWVVLDVPDTETPGCTLQIIQYLLRQKAWAEATCGPNGIYGIGGFYFCTHTPVEDAKCWYRLLSSIGSCSEQNKRTVLIGRQQLHWISPAQFQWSFGVELNLDESGGARLGAVKLFTSDIKVSLRSLQDAGFIVKRSEPHSFHTCFDLDLGYAFHVEQGLGASDYAADINRRLLAGNTIKSDI